MSDVNSPAQFLAWSGEIPFLVTWTPDPDKDAGTLTICVADTDFKRAWAQSPTGRTVSKSTMEYYGLQDFAENYVCIMQDAHDVELRYEAEHDTAGQADLDARCGGGPETVPA